MSFLDKYIPYKIFEFDLSTPRTDSALGLTKLANTMTILKVDSPFSFKINDKNNDSIEGILYLFLDKIIIKDIYITNAAGTGKGSIFLSWSYGV